jgi:hypothetical protein
MGAALGVGAAVSACGGGSAGTPGGQAADIAEGPYEGEKVTLASGTASPVVTARS